MKKDFKRVTLNVAITLKNLNGSGEAQGICSITGYATGNSNLTSVHCATFWMGFLWKHSTN